MSFHLSDGLRYPYHQNACGYDKKKFANVYVDQKVQSYVKSIPKYRNLFWAIFLAIAVF